MQDSTRVLLGVGASSDKNVTQFDSDPATFLAGLAVRMKDDSTLSVTKADGPWVGVSFGKSLSDIKKTAVARCGLKIPVRMALKRATGVITISSYANLVSGTDDSITLSGTTFTAQAGAVTPGGATFQAATGNNETAASLAAQINAHATVSLKVFAVAALAVVTVYSKVAGVGSTGTGNDIGLTYTDNDTNVGIVLSGLSSNKLSGGSNAVTAGPAVKGASVYFNDATGEADHAAFGTISNAVYVSAGLTGMTEDSTEVGAAYVDMSGGL